MEGTEEPDARHTLMLADLMNVVVDLKEDVIPHSAVIGEVKKVTEIDSSVLVSKLPSCSKSLVVKRLPQDDAEELLEYTMYWDGRANPPNEQLVATALPLPLGDVALATQRLRSKTRQVIHAACLDPFIWRAALRDLRDCDVIPLLASPCKIVMEPSEEVPAFTCDQEGNFTERKFPWETTKDYGAWMQKMVNENLPILLNGSNGEEVKLYLGVTAAGIGIGFPGGLKSHFEPRIFPPIHELRFKEFKLSRPVIQDDMFVEWIEGKNEVQEQKNAWKVIEQMDGQGWLLEDGERTGVVKLKKRENDEPLDRGLVALVQFERSVFVVSANPKPRLIHSYFNCDIQLGWRLPLFAFEAWLRLKKPDELFLKRFMMSHNLSLTIMKSSSFDWKISFDPESCGRDTVLDILWEQNVKTRFVMVELQYLEDLLRLIEEDERQNKVDTKPVNSWFVSVVIKDLELMEDGENVAAAEIKPMIALEEAIRKFSINTQVHFEQILFSRSLGILLANVRSQSLELPSDFCVIGKSIIGPENASEEILRLAKAWVFPDDDEQDREEVPWILIQAGLVVTHDAVHEVISLVNRILDGGASPHVVSISSPLRGCGLSTLLRLTAIKLKSGIAQRKDYEVILLHKSPSSWHEALARTSKVRAIWILDRDVECPLQPSLNCIIIRGHSRPSRHGDDIRLTPNWSRPCLQELKRILCVLPFKRTTHDAELDVTLSSMLERPEFSRGGPFFMLPIVAARGRYTPIRSWIQQQVQEARNDGRRRILSCMALLTLTIDNGIEGVVMDDFDPERFPLLVRVRRNGHNTYRFGHKLIARLHLQYVYDGCFDDEGDETFPRNFLQLLEDLRVVIEILPQKASQKIVRTIFHDDAGKRFTDLCTFALDRPKVADRFLEIFEKISRAANSPEVDLYILLSRLQRAFGKYAEGIKSAQLALAKQVSRKAKNNLAQSYADAANSLEGRKHEEYYREAHIHFKELQEVFESELEMLEVGAPKKQIEDMEKQIEDLKKQIEIFELNFKSKHKNRNSSGKRPTYRPRAHDKNLVKHRRSCSAYVLGASGIPVYFDWHIHSFIKMEEFKFNVNRVIDQLHSCVEYANIAIIALKSDYTWMTETLHTSFSNEIMMLT